MKTGWVALALLLAMPAWADAEWVGAKVVKIEAEKSRVTLQHERIKSLPMEAMTMPFKVESPALLGPIKVGQRVRFTFVDKDGHLIITALEPLK
jgi:Cu/Ag efflux protein CusF